MADSDDDSNGSLVGKFISGLENRLIMLLTATFLSVTGATLIQKANPETRSDPFTGSQGRVLEARIDKLENLQQLDDDHRIKANEGYARIRDLERRCTINSEQISTLRRDVQRLEKP